MAEALDAVPGAREEFLDLIAQLHGSGHPKSWDNCCQWKISPEGPFQSSLRATALFVRRGQGTGHPGPAGQSPSCKMVC